LHSSFYYSLTYGGLANVFIFLQAILQMRHIAFCGGRLQLRKLMEKD